MVSISLFVFSVCSNKKFLLDLLVVSLFTSWVSYKLFPTLLKEIITYSFHTLSGSNGQSSNASSKHIIGRTSIVMQPWILPLPSCSCSIKPIVLDSDKPNYTKWRGHLTLTNKSNPENTSWLHLVQSGFMHLNMEEQFVCCKEVHLNFKMCVKLVCTQPFQT